jgi:hypothetical protein
VLKARQAHAEANLFNRSITNPEDFNPLIERLGRLRPDGKAGWGTLDAPRMLCHLADGLRVALGELPTVPQHSWLSRTLGRFVVVHTGFKPPPGKVQTAPEMLTSRPATWQSDVDACKQLAARVASGAANAVHPAFGPLSPQEWGQLSWKHIDHHLRQFGV